MSQKYSEETREILADFLRALGQREEFDPQLMAELRRLTDEGRLGHHSQIKQIIEMMEAHGHEYED